MRRDKSRVRHRAGGVRNAGAVIHLTGGRHVRCPGNRGPTRRNARNIHGRNDRRCCGISPEVQERIGIQSNTHNVLSTVPIQIDGTRAKIAFSAAADDVLCKTRAFVDTLPDRDIQIPAVLSGDNVGFAVKVYIANIE